MLQNASVSSNVYACATISMNSDTSIISHPNYSDSVEGNDAAKHVEDVEGEEVVVLGGKSYLQHPTSPISSRRQTIRSLDPQVTSKVHSNFSFSETVPFKQPDSAWIEHVEVSLAGRGNHPQWPEDDAFNRRDTLPFLPSLLQFGPKDESIDLNSLSCMTNSCGNFMPKMTTFNHPYRARLWLSSYLKAAHAAAACIQRTYQSYKIRKGYLILVGASIYIQAAVRRHIQRKKYSRLHGAATTLQRCWRHYSFLRSFHKQCELKKRERTVNTAALKLQAHWRAWCQKRQYQILRACCIQIQRWVRACLLKAKACINATCRIKSPIHSNVQDAAPQNIESPAVVLKENSFPENDILMQKKAMLSAIRQKRTELLAQLNNEDLPLSISELVEKNNAFQRDGSLIPGSDFVDSVDCPVIVPLAIKQPSQAPRTSLRTIISRSKSPTLLNSTQSDGKLMQEKSLQQLTAANTKRNALYHSKLSVHTVPMNIPRPPSPTSTLLDRMASRKEPRQFTSRRTCPEEHVHTAKKLRWKEELIEPPCTLMADRLSIPTPKSCLRPGNSVSIDNSRLQKSMVVIKRLAYEEARGRKPAKMAKTANK